MSNAAETKTVTQYGIRKPNGEIEWSTKGNAGRYLDVNIEEASKGSKTINPTDNRWANDGRATMATVMRKKAKAVGVLQEDFVNGHEYVTRDIITITMEPVVVPTPAVDVRF